MLRAGRPKEKALRFKVFSLRHNQHQLSEQSRNIQGSDPSISSAIDLQASLQHRQRHQSRSSWCSVLSPLRSRRANPKQLVRTSPHNHTGDRSATGTTMPQALIAKKVAAPIATPTKNPIQLGTHTCSSHWRTLGGRARPAV